MYIFRLKTIQLLRNSLEIRNSKLEIPRRGFTLVELIIYIAMFSLAAIALVGILIVVLRVNTKQVSSTEVADQLNLVLNTVTRVVRESSLIEKVYEGTNEAAACATFCSVKLRMANSSLDPTIVRADSTTKRVYLKQGAAAETELTNTKVSVNNLVFAKNDISGGHTTLEIDLSITYVSPNPILAITRSIHSAIGRATAATFDDHLLPVSDNLSNVGISGQRWRDFWFSGNGVMEGNLVLGGTSIPAVTGATSLFVPDGKYGQFQNNDAGAPPSVDCDQDIERGRFSIDTTNNRLYVCNGAARGWDYVALTN